MAEFVMPILTVDMKAGTLTRWRKQVGDAVKRSDIIAEVETDKGLIDVEVFTSGVLERILVQAGETVPTGTALAIIREEAGAAAPAAPLVSAPPIPAAVVPAAPMPAPPGVPVETPGRVRISPLARKLAAELGVDPSSIRGSGPGGAIMREDIERAAAARIPSPVTAAEPPDRQARMRQLIGAAMARSKREIPHYYLSTTIDMARTVEWLTEGNLKRPVTDRLLTGVLLIKAVALALREVPELNAVWRGAAAVPSQAVHIGVAISLRGGGLVAPAIHDADRLSVGDLMAAFRDLVRRARGGGLRSSELSDPTITITSLGEQGVESVFGIIFPPQVAIVGFGKVAERPWVVDGQVVPRPLLTATLSADHRVSDGHRGGLFLGAVERLLQEPEKL
ncbi:MAG TPA: dihydrolipoamide acetyltransferase family protein [Candidatus Bathyarchaeia archaeon]|nr:dihydrolipoamide acetyltransferase family protein [Candidatus Bathyarchaeia archaeon]